MSSGRDADIGSGKSRLRSFGELANEFSYADAEAAILGGHLLSSGGSGRSAAQRNLKVANVALDYNGVTTIDLDALPADAEILLAIGIGAPGIKRFNANPRDAISAAEAYIRTHGRRPDAIMAGHVPGLWAWLISSFLNVPLVDAAANGRGHPTSAMGAMGLMAHPEIQITQAAYGGAGRKGDAIGVVTQGSLERTAMVLRAAAVANDGIVLSVRGPYTHELVRGWGAVGAISFQMHLGHQMLAAQPGRERVEAAAAAMNGSVLGVGTVTANSVTYNAGFECGTVEVECDGRVVSLAVLNEYMAVDVDGVRVSTFPDMIGTLDPADGHPVAITELQVGSQVAVLIASKRDIPTGEGVYDPSIYPEVEVPLGIELRKWALNRDV